MSGAVAGGGVGGQFAGNGEGAWSAVAAGTRGGSRTESGSILMGSEGERRPCQTCGWRVATRKGRCMACYRYWLRTGVERPDELIVEHARRLDERRRVSRSVWRV